MWTCLIIVDEDYIALRNLLNRTIRHSPMKIYKVKHCIHISNHFREPNNMQHEKTRKNQMKIQHTQPSQKYSKCKTTYDMRFKNVTWTMVHTRHSGQSIMDISYLCENTVRMVQVIGLGYGDKVQKDSTQTELRFRRYGHLKFEFKSE